MTWEQWAVLRVLVSGPSSRDEVARVTGISEHLVGGLLDGLMRDSLVGRVRRSSGRPQYGLTKAGKERVGGASNWRDLYSDMPPALWGSSLQVFEPMVPSPPPRPTNWEAPATPPAPIAPGAPAAGPGGDAELRKAALAALLAGRLTRDRMAEELGVSEHVAGRVLDRLIWDSLVVRRSQDSGRPTYELLAAGRQKVLGVSHQLQTMAQQPAQQPGQVPSSAGPAQQSGQVPSSAGPAPQSGQVPGSAGPAPQQPQLPAVKRRSRLAVWFWTWMVRRALRRRGV